MKPWQLLIILSMTMLVGACAGTRAAYQAAEGLEEKAYVVGEHYFALVREANDLKDRGVLAGSQLTRAQGLVRTTRPVILELTDTVAVWAQVKNAENERDLEAALNAAAIAVSRLSDVIKAVRPVAKLEDDYGPFDHRLARAA